MIILTYLQMMLEYSFVTSSIFMDPFSKFQKMKLTPYPKECILISTACLYQKVFMRGYCYLKHGYVIACAVDVDGKQLRLQLDKEGQNCYCVNAGDLQSHHCTCRDDYLQMLLRLLAHRVLMYSLLNNTLHMSLPIYICINQVNRWKLQVTSAHHSDFADCPRLIFHSSLLLTTADHPLTWNDVVYDENMQVEHRIAFKNTSPSDDEEKNENLCKDNEDVQAELGRTPPLQSETFTLPLQRPYDLKRLTPSNHDNNDNVFNK